MLLVLLGHHPQPLSQRQGCWLCVVSRHLRRRWASSSQNWKVHKMPEAFRQTVCGQRQIRGSGCPLIPHFSFTAAVSFPRLASKLRRSLLSLGPLAFALPENHQPIILMIKPSYKARAYFPPPIFDLCRIFFFGKTILASTPNSFHILEILQWLFGTPLYFMSVDLC